MDTPIDDERVYEKLTKILARVKRGSTEGEVQAATNLLHQHLRKYNLDIADLEARGGRPVARVGESAVEFDNPNARFKWKLDLGEHIAEHFFCHPIINRREKTILFVGRPENVDSLKLLYGWLVAQIQALAREERRRHIAETGEHIDPLRWQLGFGEGAAYRLGERLAELRESLSATETALVVHHKSEISDFMEERYGWRVDGKRTNAAEAYQAQNRAAADKREALMAECRRTGDMEPYYTEYPWERPVIETEAQKKVRINKERAQDARWARSDERRSEAEHRRSQKPKEQARRRQASTALDRGVDSADRINLTPFLNGATDDKKRVR